MGRLTWRICLAFAMIVLAMPHPVLAQAELFDIAPYLNESFNQSYVYLDIYVSESGRCFVYGETSENITLPGVLVDGDAMVGKVDWLTSKSGGTWSFNISIPLAIDDVLINLYLPENISVGDMDANMEAWFSADEGLVISFAGEFLVPSIFFEYTLGDTSGTDTPGKPDDTPSGSGIPFSYFLFFAAALAALAVWRIPRNKQAGSRLDAVRPTLNDRERMIIDRIIELGGEAKQRTLEKGCDIPKASLSRILFHMEKKGLIRRHKIGINKRIVLGDEYK